MFLGRVVGEVWATKKVQDLAGLRLLVVEALDERRDPGAPKVTPVVCADPLGAAIGDGDFAFEAAIVGSVDDFDVPDAPASWRMTDPAQLAAERTKLRGGL
ncbi:MAG: hypothetical protein NTY35_13615 [Planctomycetota bacterium]|nr:hypothetical protein [Planctomycetota bacterium]